MKKPKKEFKWAFNSHTNTYIKYEKTWHRQGRYYVPRTKIIGHYDKPNGLRIKKRRS